MARNILVVEDDRNISDLIRMYLEKEGFEVRSAYDGGKAVEEFDKQAPDMVLLDIMLPVVDGWGVCAHIREKGKTPIIMLTAKSDVGDRITGLEMGADDYLVKPFALEELSARLRVLTRSQFGAGDSRLVAGDLTLDTGTRRVKRGDAEIALSAREYALLEYLMHNKGIVLSREKIENHVWNFDYEGGTNVVDVYIRYLRKKIDDGHERKLIHTVRGMGYVLREETP